MIIGKIEKVYTWIEILKITAIKSPYIRLVFQTTGHWKVNECTSQETLSKCGKLSIWHHTSYYIYLAAAMLVGKRIPTSPFSNKSWWKIIQRIWLITLFSLVQITSNLIQKHVLCVLYSLTTRDFFCQVIIFIEILFYIHIYWTFERRSHELANHKLFIKCSRETLASITKVQSSFMIKTLTIMTPIWTFPLSNEMIEFRTLAIWLALSFFSKGAKIAINLELQMVWVFVASIVKVIATISTPVANLGLIGHTKNFLRKIDHYLHNQCFWWRHLQTMTKNCTKRPFKLEL